MIHKISIPTPFAVGDVNSFLLKGDALTLFDVGPKTPEALEALESGIKQAGYELKDIEQVVLTHHHPDHSGWVDAFDQATILGHEYNQVWLTRDVAFFRHHDTFYLERLLEEGVPASYHHWVKKMKRPISFVGERPLDKFLSEGDALPGHPGWNVMETPGHALSHLSFWNGKTGEMIGGDHVLATVSSNPLIEPPLDPDEERPKSLLLYNASLKRLLDMPIDIIYSGHGDDVRNVHELIQSRLQKQRERALKVLGMLEHSPRTIFELTQQLFPSVYEKELGLTLSETIGQVDYLLDEQLISESIGEGGILLYEKH